MHLAQGAKVTDAGSSRPLDFNHLLKVLPTMPTAQSQSYSYSFRIFFPQQSTSKYLNVYLGFLKFF